MKRTFLPVVPFLALFLTLLAGCGSGTDGIAPHGVLLNANHINTIWTMTLDAKGNLTVNNALFEGIDSSRLPAAPPRF